MAKEKKTFSFDPLPVESTKKEIAPVQEVPAVVAVPSPPPIPPVVAPVAPTPPPARVSTESLGGATKVTFDCENTLLEKMKDYGYWEGLTQKDIILEALDLYFSTREIRPRPEKIKNRPKVGRKPKANQ